MELTAVDPDVAAATFRADIDALWATGRPEQRGWTRTSIDPLTGIVHMPGRTADGPAGLYHLRLHASHYGPHPPKVTFVEPVSWAEPPQISVWLPRLENPPSWFGLHPVYSYPDGRVGQLVCFSHSLDYYADHGPKSSEQWEQGVHTVAATLNRIYEILGPPHHKGPHPPPETQERP
jgi:hypothetical protein